MTPGSKDRRIVHVPCSAQDLDVLSGRDGNALPAMDQDDFVDKVVLKPWGYEYLLFRSAAAAGWILFIQPGHGTSMHCHRTKSTSLIVLDGVVRCGVLDSSHLREPGEVMQIAPGAFHQTAAVTAQGAFVLEIESPERKLDLVRLKDSYGRVGTGYEGMEMHLDCLEEQTTFELLSAGAKACSRSFGGTTVFLTTAEELDDTLLNGSIVAVVQGGGSDVCGRLMVRPGQCIDGGDVRGQRATWLPGTLLALVSAKRPKQLATALRRLGLEA
jgi:quercetin dioxygenase-like cupin family protein